MQTQSNHALSTFKKISGVILIVIGILGLFLPFLQGILFITLGVALLGNRKLKLFFELLVSKTKKLIRKLKKR